MTRKDLTDIVALGIAVVITLGAVAGNRYKRVPEVIPEHLVCVLDLGGCDDISRGLVTGYNYYLLERYASQHGRTVDIRLAREDETPSDSLASGSVDILVLPSSRFIDDPGVRFTGVIDSLSHWCIASSSKSHLSEIDTWIAGWHESPEHDRVRDMFLKTYDPFRRRSRPGYVSPYDDIIREYADSIRMDWHLLAAVIYQESKFRIDVLSHKGASGIMQMVPSTAALMGVTDMLSPRDNIRGGAYYLWRMKRFCKWAADEAERDKFALACYNAGAGRIRDCVNYARVCGLDPSVWDNVASVIPAMGDDEVAALDTVKLGRFNGTETLEYVDRVLALAGEFRRICP